MKWLCLVLPFLTLQDPEEGLRDEIERTVKDRGSELRSRLERIVEEELRVPSGDLSTVLEKITAGSIREIVTYLASDELEGRGSGYPGNDKATEYMAGIYRKAGLVAIGDEDENGDRTYFQHFTNPRNRRRTRNTIAFLEGRDPVLKEEVVILGGHHDHLGRGRQVPAGQARGGRQGGDDIWNGADDNGSGSSTVVAVAKAFGEAGVRPRRSLIFMTFSAEEWGLIGSKYYVDHPILPISKTVAMINLDMIGRNEHRPVKIQGLSTAGDGMLKDIAKRAVAETGLNAELVGTPSVSGGNSDHSSFISRGIPAIFFFTGIHPDYHKVSDHVDRLAFDNMQKIGRTTARILWELAERPDKPSYARGSRRAPDFRTPRERPDPNAPRKLGIGPDSSFTSEDMDFLDLPESEGGIQISVIGSGSAAERAGMQEGDVIVLFAGEPFRRPQKEALKQLRERIAKVKAGEAVDAIVLRNGKAVPLKVRWD